MSTLPQPGPREPDPLSPREKKILSEIETELTGTAPQLARLTDELNGAMRTTPRRDRVLQVIALGVLVILIVPSTWIPALLIFAVMVGLPIAAGLVGRHGARGRHTDTDPDS